MNGKLRAGCQTGDSRGLGEDDCINASPRISGKCSGNTYFLDEFYKGSTIN